MTINKYKIADIAPYYATLLPFWEELTFEQLEAIDELIGKLLQQQGVATPCYLIPMELMLSQVSMN